MVSGPTRTGVFDEYDGAYPYGFDGSRKVVIDLPDPDEHEPLPAEHATNMGRSGDSIS